MQYDRVDGASQLADRSHGFVSSMGEDITSIRDAAHSDNDIFIDRAPGWDLRGHEFLSADGYPAYGHSTADDFSGARDAAHTNLLGTNHSRWAQDQAQIDISAQEPPRIATRSSLWLPVTLRVPYLLVLFFIPLILAVVILLLCYESSRHSGLGSDNGTSGLLFGWRFTPTLVAVLFVVLETFLLKDIRRTEVFARLSNRTGSSALSTILQAPGHWWNDPVVALSRRRNGGSRSLVLFWASIMTIVGSLILSPLSAAFLSSEPTQVSVASTFLTIPSTSATTQAMTPNDETLFRTVAAMVLNFKTSMWLTDDYAVIPFWPISESVAPLGATITMSGNLNWSAPTTVFHSELTCVPMTMSDMNQTSFRLSSDDGCTLQVNVAVPDSNDGGFDTTDPGFSHEGPTSIGQQPVPAYYPILNEGAWWVSTSISPTDFSAAPGVALPGYNQTELVNVSPECQNRYLLAINTPFNVTSNYTMFKNKTTILDYTSTFQISSQLCTSNYFTANLSTTVSITPFNTNITLNKTEFEERRVAIAADVFNRTSFENSFYSNGWLSKLNYSTFGTFLGPAVVLAAEYNYSIDAMLQATSLVSKAQQLQQRFLGEALLATIPKTGNNSAGVLAGTTITTKERIIAGFGFGLTLAVLLIFTSAMVLLILYYSRPSRRPLNLDRDPGSAAAVASLLSHSGTRSYFDGLERMPAALLSNHLRNVEFELDNGSLLVAQHTRIIDSASKPQRYLSNREYSKDWRPLVLRGWSSWALMFTLAALIAGLSTLFAKSRTPGLYEAGLVYQFAISLGNGYVTNLAPYSILPTLIAVIMKFWWDAIEDTFKRLQPYISMSKKPVQLDSGPALTYNSAPSLWSAGKAIHRKHWLLALVCIGAVLMEVFTVAMSALWQRVEGSRSGSVQLSRNLKLRDVPEVFLVQTAIDDPDDGDPTIANLLGQLYGQSQTLSSWMYGAVIELAYSGSPLPWTFLGSSYCPVNLPTVDSNTSATSATSPSSPTNLTLDTFAISGSLECTPVDMSNVSNWLTTWDLTNGSFWNFSAVTADERQYKTGYELGVKRDSQQSTSFYLQSNPQSYAEGPASTFFANPSRLVCCTNETDNEPGLAAIAYWSPIGEGYELYNAMGTSGTGTGAPPITNMTIKFVIGKPFTDEWIENTPAGVDGTPHYLYTAPPQLAVLNCVPVIEAGNATITIRQEDATVVQSVAENMSLVEDHAWGDYYLHHNNNSALGEGDDVDPLNNITVSYGYLFMDAMLGAADEFSSRTAPRWGYGDEVLNERLFVFRQPGLNVDLMSFAIWSLLGGDISKLLDTEILSETANKVFATFFQHFVSDTSGGGGRAFQALDYGLPADLLPAINQNGSTLTAYQDHNSSTTVSPTLSAVISRPIYKLDMPLVAVAICLGVLVFVIMISLFITVVYRHYFKALPRDVDTLASILAMVYDSPKLQHWIAERDRVEALGLRSNKNNRDFELRAMIGYFEGSEGTTRWGIELVDAKHDLLSPASFSKKAASAEYELLDRSQSSNFERRETLPSPRIRRKPISSTY